MNQPAEQAVFSGVEEESFVSYIEAMSDYGFPLTPNDFRHIVSSYLTRTDRNVKEFSNSVPGVDWNQTFLMHYLRLKECISLR